jgi:hypothetical protein
MRFAGVASGLVALSLFSSAPTWEKMSYARPFSYSFDRFGL